MIKLVPKDGPLFRQQSAKEVLEEAIKDDFETVIIFGFKNKMIYTKHSACVNCLEIKGALAAAQDELWERK